ncbi:DUF4232 domain-containing protein [Frankia sp. CH37]|nr:DUF4232 domain-containing protein [Parafrankia sp. CH37]
MIATARAALIALPLIIALPACADAPEPAAGTTTPPPSATADQPAGSGTASGPTRNAAASASRCSASDLTITLPAVTTDPTRQQNVSVLFTNRSAEPCSVRGFPGAQLRTSTADSWDLARSSQVEVRTVTLAPGGTAHATLTYLPANPPGTAGVAFTPEALVVTAPDERESTRIAWTLGPLLRQDGATHPGTYISALQPGA